MVRVKWCRTVGLIARGRMIDRWKLIENPFYLMSDNEIKNWFAEKIKRIVKLEEADNKSKGWCTD